MSDSTKTVTQPAEMPAAQVSASDAQASAAPHEPRSIDLASETLERRREAREGERVAGELRGQKARGWAERLLTRTTSGVTYAAVVLACLFWGRVPTAVLVTAMAWLCCSEFFRMTRMLGRMPNEVLGLAGAALYPLVALAKPGATSAVTLLLMIAVGAWFVLTPRANISDASVTVFGAAYTGLLFSAVVTIRSANHGFEGALLTIGVMGSVWLNDATAYLVGSRLGRHKLAPRISPNKSWEGLWGGIVGSCIVWLILAALGTCGVTLPLALVGGILCAVAGVVGDLFESRLKRAAGVKDSGNLIPGHGGMLDRSDSMLFACMTAYFVLYFGGIL